MSETYIKAEIVRPRMTGTQFVSMLISGLLMLAIITLVVWWFFAAWFPELGLTYWQLVLPIYAIRLVISRNPIGRQLTK